MTCKYCHLPKEEEWKEDVKRSFLLLMISYGKDDFLEKKEKHRIVAGTGICQCPEESEFARLETIDPFDGKKTPYPTLLAEIQKRLSELHQLEVIRMVEEGIVLSEAKKQASALLLERVNKEWSKLCRDMDNYNNAHWDEWFEEEEEIWKATKKSVNLFETRNPFYCFSNALPRNEMDESLEDILRRLAR